MADPIATRTKEEDAAAARVGSTLRGKWRLDSLLGVGGVAAVYAATHRNGQRAALKVMHEALARDPSIVQRFLREAYVANKVGHPACVRVLDDDTTEGDEPFLVMELLEGETVRDYWRRTGKTIPAQRALHIAERVLDCLAACHGAGVVHRDLKPANIFLTTGGAVKLLDFGVAREEEIRHEGDKTLGLALGTPAYMSPEQAKGQLDRIDGRSDLFSVGALLHALITGKRIHRGRTEKESLLLAANEPVPSVATVDPSMQPELVRVIDRALSWQIERRFPTAREMQSAVLAAMRVVDPAGKKAAPSAPDDEGDYQELTPVHEVISRDDPRVREVEALLGAWDAALRAGILYGFDSESAEPLLRTAFDACVEIHRRRSAPIALVVRPFGFAAFDHVLWQPERPLSAIPHRLFEGGVRGLRVMPELAFKELRDLLDCIAMPGDVDVAGAVWEATLPHVRIDACIVAHVGDIAAREAFAAESLRDEKEVARRVHAARDAGAAWNDERSPLAPDEVIRAVYASQLTGDRWEERYAELYTDGLLQAARSRNVAGPLGALRRIATELHAVRRYEDAEALRNAVAERLTQRIGPKDAPKLAAAVTGAMLGKEALDALLRAAAQNPADARRIAKQLAHVPPSEVQTVIAAATSRPLPGPVRQEVEALVARVAGPAAVDALSDRPSAVPTWRNELTPDALLPRDPAMDRYAEIVTKLAAVLEGAAGHEALLPELTRALAEESSQRPFEIFFAEAAPFVRGRMLEASRVVHETASRVATLLARCGAHALVVSAPPDAQQMRAFVSAVKGALDRAAPAPVVGPLALRTLTTGARTRGVAMERLAIEPRVMRVRSSAVAALRLRASGTDVTRLAHHVARSMVDAAGAPGWLIAATIEPELGADDASRTVSAAMLAAAMGRMLVDERSQLVRIVLAMFAPRQDGAGTDVLPRTAATLALQTSGQRTALASSVLAYELAWLRRAAEDGPLYRGARAPTLHARIAVWAMHYVEALADKSLPPPTPESVIAALADRTQDTADRTVLRLLVASLGFVPAGTVVRLSSGETAEVIASNRGTGRGPVGRLVLDENGEEYSEPFEVELALGGDEGLHIDKVVSLDQWRKGETPQRPVTKPSVTAEPAETSGARPASAQRTVTPPSPAAASPVVAVSVAPIAEGAPSGGREATASGVLSATPLVHTLVYMLDHGLSGTLELAEPDGTSHAIVFMRGGPVKVQTGRLLAPLGGILVKSGWLREADVAESVAAAKRAGVRLGEHLVSRELVARVDLLHALEVQVVHKIEALVNLDARTKFAFYRDEGLAPQPDPLEVDALSTIFAAARSWTDRDRIRKVVERAEGLVLAVHPESTLDLVELEPAERAILAEIQGNAWKAADILARPDISREAATPFLFAAIVTRQLLLPGQTKRPMGVRPSSVRVPQPSPFPASEPPSVRPATHKKVSWTELLAVRRPPSRRASDRGTPAAPKEPRVDSPPPVSVRSKPLPETEAGREALEIVRKAEQALFHKDIDGAKRVASRALDRDPSNPHVMAFWAWVRVLKGELAAGSALVEVDRALAVDETNIPARLYRAKLLKREGKLPEAMRDLERVLAAVPDHREAQNELRVLLLTLKPQR